MALKLDITLTSPAGDAFSDAISTTLTKSYAVGEANSVKKIYLAADTAKQLTSGSDAGPKLCIIKNVQDTADTDYVKLHNTNTYDDDVNNVSTLNTGETSVFLLNGKCDLYATSVTAGYLEVMIFTLAGTDRA